MSKPDHSRVIHFAEAQAGIPGSSGQRSISLLRHGSLDVKLSRPLPPNEQTPHAQDEVYVVFRRPARRPRAADRPVVIATRGHRMHCWTWGGSHDSAMVSCHLSLHDGGVTGNGGVSSTS